MTPIGTRLPASHLQGCLAIYRQYTLAAIQSPVVWPKSGPSHFTVTSGVSSSFTQAFPSPVPDVFNASQAILYALFFYGDFLFHFLAASTAHRPPKGTPYIRFSAHWFNSLHQFPSPSIDVPGNVPKCNCAFFAEPLQAFPLRFIQVSIIKYSWMSRRCASYRPLGLLRHFLKAFHGSFLWSDKSPTHCCHSFT